MKRGTFSMIAVIMMIAGIFFVSGGHSTTVKAEGIKYKKVKHLNLIDVID